MLRKAILLLVVVFIGFYMFTDPHGLATLAKQGGGNGWDVLKQLFTATITFLNSVTK